MQPDRNFVNHMVNNHESEFLDDFDDPIDIEKAVVFARRALLLFRYATAGGWIAVGRSFVQIPPDDNSPTAATK